MSIVRNLFVLVLIACVGYSGYVIYLTHYAGANLAKDAPSLDEAPLFAPESFTTLGNKQPSLEPTIVLSTSPMSEISLPKPDEAAAVDVATPHVAPVVTVSPTPAPEIAKTPAAEDFESFSSSTLWDEAANAAAEGKKYRAYQFYSMVMKRDDMGEFQDKLLAILQPLADMVVYAPHKHLALPAVTVKSGVTLEEIAKEHQVSVAFLRVINGIEPDGQPEPGDALKVVDGPITLRLNAERKEVTMWVGDGFAGILPCGDLPASLENGSCKVERVESEGQMTLKLADATLSGDAKAESDWQSLLNMLDQETSLVVTGVRPAEVEAIAAKSPMSEAQVVSAETPVEAEMTPAEEEFSPESVAPTDALRVEVFSPSKPLAVGNGANFGLRIINLSDKPAPDVSAIVFFSEGLEPIKLQGADGKLAVGQAAFRPMTLAPRGHVDLEILATVNDYGRQIYRVEVRCDAWDSHLVSEVAVSALNKAPEPPSLELTEKPQDPAEPSPSKR